jgi:hypothetical protein
VLDHDHHKGPTVEGAAVADRFALAPTGAGRRLIERMTCG